MHSAKKIKIMTNLALYDKRYGEEDRKITSLYKVDYIYRKNLSMRIGVIIGCFILVALYYCHKLFVSELDIFELFNKDEALKLGIIILAVLVIYSIIGTIVNGQRYKDANERIESYQKLLERLYQTDEPVE